MLIDTHAHLNFHAFEKDRAQVILRCEKKEMAVINVGAQFETSRVAAELTETGENFYAAIGLHPIHIYDEDFDFADYQVLINERVVAIGETGLDYFHLAADKEQIKDKETGEIIDKQKEIFQKHILLARDNDLALICHGRNAKGHTGNGLTNREVYSEMLEILKLERVKRAVFHCYSGDLETALKIIQLGYYIGVDGPVTFTKKAEELQNIVKNIPLDRILIETDSPYLTPEPHRGERNEPIYVEFVADKISELKGLKKEEVIEQVWENAKCLFRLND